MFAPKAPQILNPFLIHLNYMSKLLELMKNKYSIKVEKCFEQKLIQKLVRVLLKNK